MITEFRMVKSEMDNPFFAITYEEIGEFTKQMNLNVAEGAMYAIMYMQQCRISCLVAHYAGLIRYYKNRINHKSPIDYLTPSIHYNVIVRKYKPIIGLFRIGLVIGNSWAEHVIDKRPFSWIHVEQRIKGLE